MKTFNVDWDSLDEVTRMFSRAKARYFELRRIDDGLPSKKERARRILAACQIIWQADISSIYADMELDSDTKYYVYAHLDTSHKIAVNVNPVTTFAATLGMTFWPFYIGKGTDSRCFDLGRNETHRKVRQRMAALGKEPLVKIIVGGLSEADALQCESKLIDIFGLITSGGYLCNLDEGIRSFERRQLYRDEFISIRKINQVTHVKASGEAR